MSEAAIERAVFALVGLLGGALHFGLISYDRSLDDLPPPVVEDASVLPGPEGSPSCPGGRLAWTHEDGSVSRACAPLNG